MADILISYAREDEATAERLRDVLEGQGWNVWPDASNDGDAGGEDAGAAANASDALGDVKCVIVLWSGSAASSAELLDEASLARNAGKLVQVRIDDAEIPADLHVGSPANLIGWSGDVIHPGFRKLTQALEQRTRARRVRDATGVRRFGIGRAAALMLLLATAFAAGLQTARLVAPGGIGTHDALELGLRRFFDGAYVEAEKNLRIAADAGNGAAAYYLARMYRDGLGVRRDAPTALAWARKGASRSNALAQNMTGLLQGAGQGMARDDQAALAAYLDAADQGLAWGAFNAGYFYESGRGLAQPDATLAFDYYRRAADDGNAAAGNAIGDLYRAGRGVPQDPNRAVQWYRWAAERGNAAAQLSLGYLYANGQGVAQDDAKAVELYRRAAGQNNAGAINNLGCMYDYARGVPMDLRRAAENYRRASDLGEKAALINLGRVEDKLREARAAPTQR